LINCVIPRRKSKFSSGIVCGYPTKLEKDNRLGFSKFFSPSGIENKYGSFSGGPITGETLQIGTEIYCSVSSAHSNFVFTVYSKHSLKGHSQEKVFEIIPLNDRLGPN
jgi:hypothetical protein